MKDTVQIIKHDGKPEHAVVPFSEFEKMRRLAEAMGDIQAYDAALADSGESVPHSVMERLVEGESPLRVRREHRGLSQSALATQARVDNTYLTQLESGRKSGSIAVLRRLADALSVEVDDLIPQDRKDLYRDDFNGERHIRNRHRGCRRSPATRPTASGSKSISSFDVLVTCSPSTRAFFTVTG